LIFLKEEVCAPYNNRINNFEEPKQWRSLFEIPHSSFQSKEEEKRQHEREKKKNINQLL
jgi:hypothetical protein